MTTTLVLGGTAWLGGELARAALRQGHDVTCLARGESGSAPPGVQWVRADRAASDGYDAVRHQDWDDVVDVSWQPGLVRSALTALGPRARHWTYVSSSSVYADHSVPGADESTPLLPPLLGDAADREQYGQAKVACEQASLDAVGDRLLVARCGLIAGYGDRSDRFGYWPARFARAAQDGGEVLVPDDDGLPTQTIDVHDLAEWIVRAGVAGVVGVMNAVGERRSFAEVLRASRDAAGLRSGSLGGGSLGGGSLESGHEHGMVRVPSAWLREHAVEEFMGPRSLPLWICDPDWAGFLDRDGSRAEAAGLTHRPLSELVADALRWEQELGLQRDRRAGLSATEEAELLTRWAERA